MRNPLPQSVVEALDMIGCAGQLVNRSVLCSGNHPFIHHILIGVKRGVPTVRIRNLGLQALGTLTATITYMKGNHLAALGIHGDPNPLLIRLFLDEAAHFIRFHLKPPYHHITVIGDGLDMEMIRQCLEALDQETQERLEFDTHRTTDAAQRDPLNKQAFNQCPCVI
jgi:hypothetical protein